MFALGRKAQVFKMPAELLVDKGNHFRIFFREAVRIDLGGIAKGYAVDRAVDIIGQCGIGKAMALALAEAGADIALVATPTTVIRGMHELVEGFYRQVADASPIPVLLYSNPSVVAYEIPTSSLTTLGAHPNIIGVKDSGGDPKRFDDLRSAIDKGFSVFSGSSKTLLESAERGATGAVTASGNYAFDLVADSIRGDAAAQDELTGLVSVIEPMGRAGTKYASSVRGLQAGKLRPPLVAIGADSRAEIDAVLDSRKRS